ncbi:hypothetical protein Bb109J_c1960 [Bdellovibrio bacteriovorus]|uniref:DUF2190 family protein n=1 Tax=Bdellovibrio bacteriovorus TaxID=959 RepID=UPI00045C0C39|nr:DUF2190 family protein [Bdellovibrio bacteriovorus]AHZ84649.1 hypothetical protein EP01_06825 [Bdellovibrio bacteriovorus]BEV68540.1 hypothetical protein Bb109J_c1960 [Bdellovibrio bacteriovorus]
MRNSVRTGEKKKFVADADVAGGQLVKIGCQLVVVVADAKAGEPAVGEPMGVFKDLPKATGEAWVDGDALYWDNTAKKLTKTTSGNQLAAAADGSAASADTVGQAFLPGLLLA